MNLADFYFTAHFGLANEPSGLMLEASVAGYYRESGNRAPYLFFHLAKVLVPKEEHDLEHLRWWSIEAGNFMYRTYEFPMEHFNGEAEKMLGTLEVDVLSAAVRSRFRELEEGLIQADLLSVASAVGFLNERSGPLEV